MGNMARRMNVPPRECKFTKPFFGGLLKILARVWEKKTGNRARRGRLTRERNVVMVVTGVVVTVRETRGGITSTREGSLSDVFWQLCSGRYMYCNHVTAVFSLLYLPFAPQFVIGEAKACTRVVLRARRALVYFHEFPTIYASRFICSGKKWRCNMP